MAITLQYASELIERLQQASRLLAGFYQSILPVLDQTAQKCGLNFYSWEPSAHVMDGQYWDKWKENNYVQPASVSAWTFLPLHSFYQIYWKCKNENIANVGDVLAAFMLQTENTTYPDQWARSNVPPDPVKMASGQAVLEVFFFRCVSRKIKQNIVDLLWDTEDWNRTEGWQKVGVEALRGYYLNFDLAEFMVDPDKVVQALTPFVDGTIIPEPENN